MSNLSFARIMYGTSQQQPSYAALPLSNSPAQLSVTSNNAQPAPTPATSGESLLHKAWHVLTRHN